MDEIYDDIMRRLAFGIWERLGQRIGEYLAYLSSFKVYIDFWVIIFTRSYYEWACILNAVFLKISKSISPQGLDYIRNRPPCPRTPFLDASDNFF